MMMEYQYRNTISSADLTFGQWITAQNIRSHHPGNPLGMYWKRIKPAGFNTFPSAYPIDSQAVGMYVFVQWELKMGRRQWCCMALLGQT